MRVKLHLNRSVTLILQNISTMAFTSIFNWQKDENGVASTPSLNEE